MGYYKTINGKKYDAAIIEKADELTKGGKDGRISRDDATQIFEVVADGNSYSDIEKASVAYLRKNYKWTEAGDNHFRTLVRKWAATRRKK